MKIAVLGTGNIGGTLGVKWASAGHEIIFGTRDPRSQKVVALLERTGGAARAARVARATEAGDVVLLATPWAAVPAVVQANAVALEGKVVIDATNNFTGPVINNLAAILDAAPSARVYRAFNSLGWEIFADPLVGGVQADMFFSGPEGDARHLVAQLIADVGVRPIWVGDNDQVALVDNMGALWVNLIFNQGWGRRLAFKAVTGE